MRELVRFERESDARTLGDALFVADIESHVDEGRDGAFLVWVHDERDMGSARELVASYRRDPDAAQFAEARSRAAERRREQRKREKKSRHKVIRVRESWGSPRDIGRLTGALIVISVGVTLLSQFGANDAVTRWLTIASYERTDGLVRWDGLADLMSGQLWRLVTPIFVHFGLLHILFNMLWLKQLGTMVEQRQSPRFLALFVLATAVIPNTAQYLVSGNPLFGGMSGVVFALLGYIWIRSKVDPRSGYALPQFIVIWMMAWLVLGFTGLIGNIANTAHLAWLAVGAGWGWLDGQRKR